MKLIAILATLVVVATAAASPEAHRLSATTGTLPPTRTRQPRHELSSPSHVPLSLEVRQQLFDLTRELTSAMFAGTPFVEPLQQLLDINYQLTGHRLAVETTDLETIAKICNIETTTVSGNVECAFSFATRITELAATETVDKHIHTGCEKFHQEDGHSHGVLAMLNVLSDQLKKGSSGKKRIRRGFTALIHDIAKKDTKMVMKNGAAYPCHGLLGGVLLRMINIEPFAEFFSADDFALMSPTIEHHMCGFNATPCEFKSDTLAILPEQVQFELRQLAHGDDNGKFGEVSSSPKLFQIADKLKKLNVNDYLRKYNLTGVVFSITGASASGKSTLAKQIVAKFGKDRVFVAERDFFTVQYGRELLGDKTAGYAACYTAVKTNGDGKEVNRRLLKSITTAITEGKIVVLDTCLTMYGPARTFFMKDSILEKCLLIDVYPVRQTPIVDTDCERHEMSMESQLSVSSQWSPFDLGYYLRGSKGVDFHAMNRRARGTMSNPLQRGCNPHLALSVSSKTFTESSSFGAPVFDSVLGWVDDYHYVSLIDATRGMNVTEFIRYCWSQTSGNTTLERVDSLREMLSVYQYTVKVQNRIIETTAAKDIQYFTDNVEVVIKYVDGQNKLWNEPWMINMRAVPILFTKKEFHILPNMDRGPEVVGHKGEEDQVQDFDPSKSSAYSIFNPVTQQLAKMLNGLISSVDGLKRIIDTSKRDGICYRCFKIIQSVDPVLFAFYQRVLRSYNNPYINAFIDASPEGVLYVPASNGTAFLTDERIWAWFASAIGYSYGLTTEAQLELGSPEAVLENVIDQFIDDLEKLNLPSRGCALFEMICPNRADPFTKTAHTELATGYPEEESGITFLSYSHIVNGSIVNVPHSEVEHPFKEPSYWMFTDNFASNVRGLLTGFDNTFSGQVTMDELFEQFPRANRNPDMANLPDPEGLVLYAEVDGEYYYLKAKTDKYYKLHKVRDDKISEILALPEAFGKYYPAYNIIKNFFGNTAYINTLIANIWKLTDDETMISEASSSLTKGRTWESLPPIAQVNNLVRTEQFASIAPEYLASLLGIEEPEDDKKRSELIQIAGGLIIGIAKKQWLFDIIEQIISVQPLANIDKMTYIITLVTDVWKLLEDEKIVAEASSSLEEGCTWESLSPIAQVDYLVRTEEFASVAPKHLAPLLGIEEPEDEENRSELIKIASGLIVGNVKKPLVFTTVEQTISVVTEDNSVHPLAKIFKLVGGIH
jgi:hypothetical protein